ncbi:metalloregulator ArsR/SmtB family transcription factor [Aneurinibacillus sp. Ricciae_BoGa-3]|uniref:ArsR/SmtB family transcription factor n=1 Tax=Aneurinibacillus sp. Ricciae_BoGa-3 TaxID=3022697 RepID=UPI00233FD2D7|nr:metalloregulator ArsR/SmtB family transcription factor [Aneurinibacillus sp. Ricciae_BoGa-3]WCK54097.1 metalloregulator ArsR/SmtB family transcription factor [Aneurinibacillus sp. Ricciae_BoGa-3]
MNIELKAEDDMRVKIFKALSDPTRIEIIRTLYTVNKEMACGEVGEYCSISKSNASYHFRTLREAELIEVRKEAQTKYTKLNQGTFHKYLPGFLATL